MTVMAGSGQAIIPPPSEELHPIPLSGKMLIGRDERQVQIHLAHPQISRIHAHITLQDKTARSSSISTAPTAPTSTAAASAADHGSARRPDRHRPLCPAF